MQKIIKFQDQKTLKKHPYNNPTYVNRINFAD